MAWTNVGSLATATAGPFGVRPASGTDRHPSQVSGNVVSMVQAHQKLDKAVEEIAASLYGMIDTVVALQRAALAQFPECGSAVAVAFSAQLDQLEAIAREGAQTLR